MLHKDNFSLNSKRFYKNLNKTKKIFKHFRFELKNKQLPLLESFKKKYLFSFSSGIVKKYSKYKNIIVIGMGGSILGTQAIHSFLNNKVKKEVFFFDNLDLNLNIKFKKIKNLKNSCFIVVSKSGNTLETITNFCSFFSENLMKNKTVFITENKNSNLMEISNKLNADVIQHKDFIGGRYSVLSEVGMFPAAIMGLKILNFKNFEKLIHNTKFTSLLIHNVASIYTLNTEGIKNSVFLNYDLRLSDLCLWYQQLIGESLGKNRKGISPTISTCPKDHHSLLQLYLDGPRDKFFTFFSFIDRESKPKINSKIIPNKMKFIKNKSLNSIINAQCEATKKIFKSKNIFFRSFTFYKNNESELGYFFTFFVLETILLAKLMQINPFNQPAVEKVKIETKNILLR